MATKHEDHLCFLGYQTWYRTCGDIRASVPVIIIHGGPGLASEDMWPAQDMLAELDIPSIIYDQIGNGRSTHFPEKEGDTSFWTTGLFLEQFDQLVSALGIEQFYIWGQSWGGMMGLMLASDSKPRRTGLQKLIIQGTPASSATWVKAAQDLRAELPGDVQEVLLEHEQAGTFSDPEYQVATWEYYKRHLCRLYPMPWNVFETFVWAEKNPSVYKTMVGENEFYCSGSLQDWSIKDELHKIQVPVLYLSGEFDQATKAVVDEVKAGLKDMTWARIADASSMSHLEQPDAVREALKNFLLP